MSIAIAIITLGITLIGAYILGVLGFLKLKRNQTKALKIFYENNDKFSTTVPTNLPLILEELEKAKFKTLSGLASLIRTIVHNNNTLLTKYIDKDDVGKTNIQLLSNVVRDISNNLITIQSIKSIKGNVVISIPFEDIIVDGKNNKITREGILTNHLKFSS